MTAYQVRDASVELGGNRILREISLDVKPGQVLTLVGPNGAGKSTLLSLLAGDLAPSAGTIQLSGRELSQWPARELARERAVLLQSNQVSFSFSVTDVVRMGRAPWVGTEKIADDDRLVADALARTDTTHLASRGFPHLSGGEKARVSLARVLAQDTKIILLDEPTAALDLSHSEAVMRLCRQLAELGRAVVVVLHDLSLAAAYAHRVGLVDHGQLVALGSAAEVLTPKRLQQVYQLEVQVFRAPDGQPTIQPRRSQDLS